MLKSFILKEAETMKMTNHQNIVKFFGLENIDCSFKQALAMELCEGNVQDLIARNPNGVGTAEFMRFCSDLIKAVKHLRIKNIVHRDIKPANILFSHQKDRIIYKLADFGAARFLKPNESYGSLYGTEEYMHPEIFAKFYARGLDIPTLNRTFKANHELWSLGISMFEAATGHLPFFPEKGRDDYKTMYHMITDKKIDSISAVEIDGGIEWTDELPKECNLDDSIKATIAPFLAALLQVIKQFNSLFSEKSFISSKSYLQSSSENMWSFEQIFEQALIMFPATKKRMRVLCAKKRIRTQSCKITAQGKFLQAGSMKWWRFYKQRKTQNARYDYSFTF